MAMEMFVFSDVKLTSVTQWQAAIDAEGYPLKLAADVELDTHSGFLPAYLRGERTGFECDHFPASELAGEMPDVKFEHQWKFVLAFRWIGNFKELQAACMAAAAYAIATRGAIVNDQEPKIVSAVEARDEVRRILEDIPKLEAIRKELRHKT
jgi:hypothetical protein